MVGYLCIWNNKPERKLVGIERSIKAGVPTVTIEMREKSGITCFQFLKYKQYFS